MPLYNYHCECGKTFEAFRSMLESSSTSRCTCGQLARKSFTVPNLKTDTSFCLTGKHHISLCDSKDDVIRGRADFERRLSEKKVRVLDKSELEPKPASPIRMEF